MSRPRRRRTRSVSRKQRSSVSRRRRRRPPETRPGIRRARPWRTREKDREKREPQKGRRLRTERRPQMEETDQLLWPVAGNVLMDYSMDKSVYFATLDQYKYNPAIIIQGTLDENVMSAAPGKITKIETLEETGMTVTMDIGDGYEVIYGQLKELPVKEGDYLQAGETVGYVSEPTRFYTKEGCNVYFEVRKDGESVDPMALLQ